MIIIIIIIFIIIIIIVVVRRNHNQNDYYINLVLTTKQRRSNDKEKSFFFLSSGDLKEEIEDANLDELRADMDAIESDAKQMADAARRIAVEVQDLVRALCFEKLCVRFSVCDFTRTKRQGTHMVIRFAGSDCHRMARSGLRVSRSVSEKCLYVIFVI
jgi:hypothetical protein